MTTISESLHQGILAIQSSGVSESNSLDALLLLCKATNFSKEFIYTYPNHPMDAECLQLFNSYIASRCEAQPIAYIMGEREFYGRRFAVDSRVLIPRPDTETLVEQALILLKKIPLPTVLDLCTGSGCIGITVAAEIPDSQVTLADISTGALAIASQNSREILQRELESVQGNLFDALQNRKFHMIITNPPYLADDWYNTTAAQVKREPYLALVGGGDDGLEIIRTIVDKASDHLELNGMLLIECDDRQNTIVAGLMEKAGFSSVTSTQDLAGCRRIVWGRLSCTRN
jgi:release factor glutamine methyltransferase